MPLLASSVDCTDKELETSSEGRNRVFLDVGVRFIYSGAMPEDADFFLVFALPAPDCLAKLQRAFSALRAAKASPEPSSPDDPSWRLFFDDAALATFWWPSLSELDDWSRRWNMSPIPERFSDPSLRTPWDFSSMIEAILNAEYELVSCEKVAEGAGRLVYSPFAYPFGGTSALEALIGAFGCAVIDKSA